MRSKEEIEQAKDIFGFAALLVRKSENGILKVDDAGNLLNAIKSESTEKTEQQKTISELLQKFEWNGAATEWLKEELK